MTDFTMDSVTIMYLGTTCLRNEIHVTKTGEDEYERTQSVTESSLNEDGLTSNSKVISKLFDVMSGEEILSWINESA